LHSDILNHKKKKYDPLIVRGIHSNKEVLVTLHNEFDIQEINPENFKKEHEILWEKVIVHNLKNLEEKNNYCFSGYRLIRNKKSVLLYNDAISFSEIFDDEEIVIICEDNYDYMYSNSSVLDLYLKILHGISEFDYMENTEKLMLYLEIIEAFDSSDYRKH